MQQQPSSQQSPLSLGHSDTSFSAAAAAAVVANQQVANMEGLVSVSTAQHNKLRANLSARLAPRAPPAAPTTASNNNNHHHHHHHNISSNNLIMHLAKQLTAHHKARLWMLAGQQEQHQYQHQQPVAKQLLIEARLGAHTYAGGAPEAVAAAGALITGVRLIFLILISVLLVKLNAQNKRNSSLKQQQQQLEQQQQQQQQQELLRNRKRSVFQAPVVGDLEIGSKNSSSSSFNSVLGSQLGINSSVDNRLPGQPGGVPLARRMSQPDLRARVGATGGAASGHLEAERVRRISEISIASMSLPPGPRGLPFLGYLPFVGRDIHLTLTSLSERYGSIYQIYLGSIRVVVLNDASLVRQAFRRPEFSGRPDTQLTRILQGYGIVNSEGALWKEQRAFLHTALRKLGAKSLMSGAGGLEAKIQHQVKDFINDLRGHAGREKPCQVRPMISHAVSSVVGSIVMNLTYRRFEEKEKFDRLIDLMQEGFRLFTTAMPLDFMPIFRFLPGVSKAYNKMKKNRDETSAFFQGVADEHRRYLSETFNLGATSSLKSLHPPRNTAVATGSSSVPAPSSPSSATYTTAVDATTAPTAAAAASSGPVELEKIVARDLVDAYLVQQKKHEKDGKQNYFSDQQLVQIMNDLFSAGLETVTSTIEWSILFLILNPDCQRRLQLEIDQVIGRDGVPKLDDLSRMPYTEATIYEVLRRSNVVALGNAHATLEDASIGGFRIPKGTQVLPNLYGIHMNPRLWKEPERFDPTRFMDNERTFKPDYFIPFSVGRRMCLGDVLAKMEVFLFLVGLLQEFDISVPAEDAECPPQVKGTIGISHTAVPFRIALKSRRESAPHCHQPC